MEEGRRNLMVGVFVLAGLGALGTLIILFGQAPTWLATGNTYPLHVHFDEVSGIREGNMVTVKGIEIGRVDQVDLQQPAAPEPPPPARAERREAANVLVAQNVGVDVVLAIKTRYLIPAGSTAQTTEPMLGQGRPPIEIIPGPAGAAALPPGARIEGKIRRAIDSIFPSGVVGTFETTARQIGDAAEALTPVLDEMKQLLEPRPPSKVDQPGGPQGNMSSAVARFDASLKHFNEVLGDPQVKSQLRDTVANVHDMSEKGKKVMSDLETAATDAREFVGEARKVAAKADETLTNLDGRVTDVAQKTMDGLDRADRFLDYLNVIGEQVTSGKGTIGQLFMDGKLYEALTFTAERLGLAVEDARALIAEWRQGKVRVTAF
jgi:ABC-type transporter Mla subunit MlaD